jgi:hypothetical protein
MAWGRIVFINRILCPPLAKHSIPEGRGSWEIHNKIETGRYHLKLASQNSIPMPDISSRMYSIPEQNTVLTTGNAQYSSGQRVMGNS